MFDSIFYNGDEYKQMWLNGSMIWEKNNGGEEIVYPYDDADSVITFMNTSSSARSVTFDIIDSSLPYSINGTATNTFSFPSKTETQLKFVNLKPRSKSSYVIPINIEQLRIPNLTDLSYLFYYFGYNSSYEYSWSPQYFEFNQNPTNMSNMFYYCRYLTDDMMDEFMPYFPNTSNVTDMYGMFYSCSSLTSLDLTSLDTSGVIELTILDNLQTYKSIFLGMTTQPLDVYISEDKWTLGTGVEIGGYNSLNFIVKKRNGEVAPRPTDLLLDFTIPPLQLPTWIDYETKGSSYYFSSDVYHYDKSITGLVAYQNGTGSRMAWSCYKLVAPTTGMLEITFRVNVYGSSSYPFTIHATSSATQPSYNSETNRILCITDDTYNEMDGVATLDVVAGETYYIHLQYRSNASSTTGASSCSCCIRSIEIIPPIKSINGLTYDVDLNNINQKTFTVSPIIEPSVYDTNDLEIIYDSNYMTINPTTFEITLWNGSQGMSHTVIYRSKADNSISKSITFYVNADLEIPYKIDFTKEFAPILPNWFIEETKNSKYYYTHGVYAYDDYYNYGKTYGLVENTFNSSGTSIHWTCYKVVAPITGSLDITFRVNSYGSSYPFAIHSTTNATQPSYSSSTNRLINVTGSTYQKTDGVVTINVVAGETYYIHIQHRRYYNVGRVYSSCIRSIEIIPTE